MFGNKLDAALRRMRVESAKSAKQNRKFERKMLLALEKFLRTFNAELMVKEGKITLYLGEGRRSFLFNHNDGCKADADSVKRIIDRWY